MKVPLAKPYFDEKEEKACIEVLRSGWVAQGPKNVELEQAFAKYTNTKYAIAVSNGTTGLHLALIAGGIKSGDEVIVPSYSFIASVNVVIHAGATPVFIDVDEKTFNLDPKHLEKLITKKTKAILTVDQIGLPSDIDTINKIARKHKLFVIADAACAIGARYKGKQVGGLADVTCFSLHARKLITTGEGGVVTTNKKYLADKIKMWRSHGVSVSAADRHKMKKVMIENYAVPGYNYRLSDIQAAVGIEQLKKLPSILQKRKKLADRYNSLLKSIPFLELPSVPEYAVHTWQTYIVKLVNNSPISRVDLMQKLLDDGIATRRGIMASHKEEFYKKMYPKLSLPITEKLDGIAICLPIFPQMTREEQDYVIERLKYHLKS